MTEPAAALHAILDEAAGAPPADPARDGAERRRELRGTLRRLVADLTGADDTPDTTDTAGPDGPGSAHEVADLLAVVIDGIGVSTAHLGADGPATSALAWAHRVVDELAAAAR